MAGGVQDKMTLQIPIYYIYYMQIISLFFFILSTLKRLKFIYIHSKISKICSNLI